MTTYATLNLPIVDWDGEYFAVVPAKIIHDLAPHIAHVATFAVHRSAGSRAGGGVRRPTAADAGARGAAGRAGAATARGRQLTQTLAITDRAAPRG